MNDCQVVDFEVRPPGPEAVWFGRVEKVGEYGIVVSKGDRRISPNRYPMDVQVGQRVAISTYQDGDRWLFEVDYTS